MFFCTILKFHCCSASVDLIPTLYLLALAVGNVYVEDGDSGGKKNHGDYVLAFLFQGPEHTLFSLCVLTPVPG